MNKCSNLLIWVNIMIVIIISAYMKWMYNVYTLVLFIYFFLFYYMFVCLFFKETFWRTLKYESVSVSETFDMLYTPTVCLAARSQLAE